MLETAGHHATSVLLVGNPYAQRRSHATARKLWPEVDVVCGLLPG